MSLKETLEREHADALARGEHPIAWNLTSWAAVALNSEGVLHRGYFMGLPVYMGYSDFTALVCSNRPMGILQ